MRIFYLVIVFILVFPSHVRGAAMLNLPQDTLEVCGEGVYYLEGKDNLEEARSMALEIAKSNAIASAFGTAVSSSTHSHTYESSDGEYFNSFSSLMRSIQTGIWIKDIDEPEVTSFMDDDYSFGFKAKVRGIVRPLTLAPIETEGRVYVGRKAEKEYHHVSSVLKRGDEFYFGFKAAADGFLAVYIVDEDELVCKAAPIGNDSAPLKRIKAERESVLRDDYIKNMAELSHPEYREAYNRVVYVFSPNEFTLPLSEEADPKTGLPPSMDFAKFHSWLQEMAVADPNFTVTWQTITIRR